MLDYLYYKLYRAVLKGSLRDIPQFMTPVFFGGLISINFLVINAFLSKIGVVPYFFVSKKLTAAFAITFIVLAMMYYRKEKRELVFEKYSHEVNSERVKGNIIVIVYVVASFLAIFAIAFFRPGKL